jgi:myo-inositol-1(or 4)-monophosphatase
MLDVEEMKIRMNEFIVDLTKEAGSVLMDYFRQDQGLISLRSTAKDAVTKYDWLIDQFIIEKIRGTYPEHSLLTEESGYHAANPDWLWIVDSLDGTGNFANQNPFFSVCIALVYKGEITLGAIYAPAIDEFYLAERGKGAYLNQKRISVSNIGELQKSYLFYCEGGDKNRGRTGTILNKVYPKVMDIRKLGSAGIETAWVAAGRGEAYFTTKIEPWDIAPGVLLVLEAGGQVTDFTGKPWQQERGDFLFSNKKTHSTILELLHEA